VLELCGVRVVLYMCCGSDVLVIWLRRGCCVLCVVVFHVFMISAMMP
jgi:hypothetical protein